jgi:TRAP-type C4-dicarboxylate transport system substrate-binding protein
VLNSSPYDKQRTTTGDNKVNKTFLTITLVLFATLTLLAQQYTIKFATIAPEGSTWLNVMREYDAQVRKESSGKLGFKIYPGGVVGDEIDVLRKIRVGQYHAAGFTGVGLTEIAPKVRILDAPFLFKNANEADYIYKNFDAEFSRAFEDGGYVLLGWAEVGFVYVFTQSPVSTAADMKRVKMWMWEGDPIAEAAFKAIGVSPIPLSITDVRTSLQTGLVNAFYVSPYAAIALQWFTQAKYILDVPLANSAGAVVLSKKMYDKLPADLQEILVRNGKTFMARLTQLSREENRKSLETLRQKGIKITEPSLKQTVQDYDAIGQKARRMLVGRLFSEDLLNRVEQAVSEFRKTHKDSK